MSSVEYLGPNKEQNFFLKEFFFFNFNCYILHSVTQKGQLSPWQELRLPHFIATSLTYTSCGQTADGPFLGQRGWVKKSKHRKHPAGPPQLSEAGTSQHLLSFPGKVFEFLPDHGRLTWSTSKQMGQKPASTQSPIPSCTLTQPESSVSN